MKRYMAFYGECKYPSGGMGDFVGDFDSVEEATDAIHKKALDDEEVVELPDDYWGEWGCWMEVYDTKEMKSVYSK